MEGHIKAGSTLEKLSVNFDTDAKAQVRAAKKAE